MSLSAWEKKSAIKFFWSHMTEQNLMADFFSQALSDNGASTYLLFETGQNIRIERTLHAIYMEYGQNRKYSPQLVNALTSTFFLLLLQDFEDTAQVSTQSDLLWKREFANILHYIQDHFQTVTLEELSGLFGYSNRQLIRIIQSCTGSSLTNLQTRLRMETASRRLRSGAAINDVALEVEFTNRSSFYRAFQRYFGCTPGEYIAAKGLHDATK